MVGFFAYYLLPIEFVGHVHHSIGGPAPYPFQKQCAYVINTKTVFNSPLGNPRRLDEELKGRGLIAHQLQEQTIGYRELGLLRWSAYLMFEYIPKRLLLEKPSDPYSLIGNEKCLPIASDIPVLFSVWSLDFPNYGFILGSRKNLLYADSCEESAFQSYFIPYTGSGRLEVYVYSHRGFSFPGESFKTPGTLTVNLFERRSLLFVLKDGTVYRVFDQRSIKERLSEAGIYQVFGYTYKFKLWRLYFGLRFLFCTPPFYAM
ncbi:MAG: hypothetical protein RMK75_04790 [Aquificaceae bacterium]|nr:hypothetical protein [Aquificaceae bacterium]MCS7278307.1 hypothetical protein [Aquificaceae bacterium]MDW8066682.1 hypothetical protein [Aquificaceae bacterium]MDW8423624.1 hypothetical protein [Aquificaceae bacterium]